MHILGLNRARIIARARMEKSTGRGRVGRAGQRARAPGSGVGPFILRLDSFRGGGLRWKTGRGPSNGFHGGRTE